MMAGTRTLTLFHERPGRARRAARFGAGILAGCIASAGCAAPADRTADVASDDARLTIPLVSPTGIRFEPRTPTAEQAARIARADSALETAPADVDAIIEAALAREAIWRYADAIALYTRGLRLAPDDYRLHLGRAHRLIRLRRFDRALADLDRSANLDPAGFNTAYLRGLTYYLLGRYDDAAAEYARCMDMAADTALDPAAPAGDPRSCSVIEQDPSSRVSITAWRYRALRAAGRHDEAARLLGTIPDRLTLSASPADAYPGTPIAPDSNEHYYRMLLFFRGLMSEDQVLDRDWAGEQWSTLAHGVAAWHLAEGRRDRAIALLREIVAEPYWARLGHVAAETDLIRLGEAAPAR